MRDRGASDKELHEVTGKALQYFATRCAGSTSFQGSCCAQALRPSRTGYAGSEDLAPSEPSSSTSDQPPYPTSFASLASLIASGAALDASNVPGMRLIPDKLNDEPPSEAKLAGTASAPPKPWEAR